MSAANYRKVFDAACRAAGLDNSFKPYSLRRGGATHHFKAFGDMSRTMEIGRWSEVRTARIYINTALLELTSIQKLQTSTIQSAAKAALPMFAAWLHGKASKCNVETAAVPALTCDYAVGF